MSTSCQRANVQYSGPQPAGSGEFTLQRPGSQKLSTEHRTDQPGTAHFGERTACALATRTVEHIVEVLVGRRSLHQIRDRLSGPVAGLLGTSLGGKPGRRWFGDYRLGSVHACQTTPRKVEACAVIDTSSRARALVLRLEQEDTTWSCTMLSLV